MLKTAKNLALNHVAKWDNKFNDSLEDFTESAVVINELQTRNFETEYESKERFLLFCKATEQLSNAVRKSFILKKVYGLSQKEIANYLEISESTVEKHVAKGILSCARYMDKIENSDNQNKHVDSTVSVFNKKSCK